RAADFVAPPERACLLARHPHNGSRDKVPSVVPPGRLPREGDPPTGRQLTGRPAATPCSRQHPEAALSLAGRHSSEMSKDASVLTGQHLAEKHLAASPGPSRRADGFLESSSLRISPCVEADMRRTCVGRLPCKPRHAITIEQPAIQSLAQTCHGLLWIAVH
ncbi:hypothetical protein BC831DRAFT_453213, partial [Entophlyctis helioformis]